MKVIKQSQKALVKAIKVFKNGEVIVCPTDTVYGFLADASNKKAVNKIYKIKKRPRSKPLPVFVKDLKMAKELVEISEWQEKVLKKYWPGKYTFVLKSKSQKLYGMAKDNTIALRIPKYKFLNDLLKKINRPLVQTSVNTSGKKSLTRIGDITKFWTRLSLAQKRNILIIDGGNLKIVTPSKVIDLTTERLTRLR